MQRKGKKDLLAYEKENLAKNPEENDKKLWASLVQFGERKSLKTFLKSKFETSNFDF